MKRFVTIALALVMLLSLVACSKVKLDGTTWTGKIDVTDQMKELLSNTPFAQYLKDCVLNAEVSFTKDEAKIKYDTKDLEAAFKAAIKQVPDISDELVEQFMEGFVGSLQNGMQEQTESYKVDGKKITIGEVTGTVSGKTMKLTFPELGEATFTKK